MNREQRREQAKPASLAERVAALEQRADELSRFDLNLCAHVSALRVAVCAVALESAIAPEAVIRRMYALAGDLPIALRPIVQLDELAATLAKEAPSAVSAAEVFERQITRIGVEILARLAAGASLPTTPDGTRALLREILEGSTARPPTAPVTDGGA